MSTAPQGSEGANDLEAAVGLHRDAVQLTKEYGIFTLRTCLILNGGAILAILGLLGSLLSKTQAVPPIKLAEFLVPFYSFSFGLLVCVLAAMCGYFNFLHSQAGLGAIVSQRDAAAGLFAQHARRARAFMVAAHTLGFVSIASFVVGAITTGLIFARY